MYESPETTPVALPKTADAAAETGVSSRSELAGPTAPTAQEHPAGAVPADPRLNAAGGIDRRNLIAIALLLVSAFVVMLNETVMSVALPVLMRELGVEPATGQWLTTAYMLTMAVIIPITGFLLQRFNTRPIFMTAMVLFGSGTLIAAIAPDFGVLLIGRIVQAAGTAIISPLLMTTVMTLVPPHKRGQIMGFIAVVMSVAPALGPTASGMLIDAFGWRGMFWFVLPIAVLALALGMVWLRNVSEPRRISFDLLSVLLSALAFSALIYGLAAIGEVARGATEHVPSWMLLTGGALLLGAFIWRQLLLQRKDSALLDLRTLQARSYSAAVITMTILMGAMLGAFLVLPIYMQNVLGMTPLEVGLILLPGGLIQGLLGPVIGRLYDRVGPRKLLLPGTIGVVVVFAAFASMDAATEYWVIQAVQIVFSISLAFMFTPLFSAGLGSVQPRFYSHGSAIIGTLQQVGGAAGTALFAVVFTLHQLSLESQGATLEQATVGGFQLAMWVGAALVALAGIAAMLVSKPADEMAASGVPH